MAPYLSLLKEYEQQGRLPHQVAVALRHFYHSYSQAALSNGCSQQQCDALLLKYTSLIDEQIAHPFHFAPFHLRIKKPVDYYRFGLDLFRPLILFDQSHINGLPLVGRMERQLAAGENVILFGNHQIEPDPQVISLLLEKEAEKAGTDYGHFAEEMIFVAGHKVTSDPVAVPLSKGRNLLCIYSKKHIDHPPENKQAKIIHNQATMRKMSQLLEDGGRCIYVAPSGGRDRPGANGHLQVAEFDPQSIEMFYLMAQHAGRVAHFYPLALATYHMLPPPDSVQRTLGEERHARAVAVHLAFGEEIDMEAFAGSDVVDKKKRRALRAQAIWRSVQSSFLALIADDPLYASIKTC